MGPQEGSTPPGASSPGTAPSWTWQKWQPEHHAQGLRCCSKYQAQGQHTPPLCLFYCHRVKGQGSCEGLLTWVLRLEGSQLGWSHSQGTLEGLGSDWEFGKACLPASRPAACLVHAHAGLGFTRESGAKGSCHLLPPVQPCVSRRGVPSVLVGHWYTQRLPSGDPPSHYPMDWPARTLAQTPAYLSRVLTRAVPTSPTPAALPKSSIDLRVLRAREAQSL